MLEFSGNFYKDRSTDLYLQYFLWWLNILFINNT